MKIRPFEIFLIAFFVISAIASLIVFRLYEPEKSDKEKKVITKDIDIWGTLPAEVMDKFLKDLSANVDESYKKVKYTYFDTDSFEIKLTRALADNAGPDLVLFSSEELAAIRKRISPIPYKNVSLRDIKDRYIDGASVFALYDGLYGLPLMVDPLVMYWNEDLLSNAGYLEPPKTWEKLINEIFPKLINRNVKRVINRSVVAMGEYNNIKNSFALISALTIQGGSKMVVDTGRSYMVQLNLDSSVSVEDNLKKKTPFFNAVSFYTRFGKPDDFLYSWNKTFSSDLLNFLSGDLVFYFGFASESNLIIDSNPNLNFDLSEIPQGGVDIVRRTYGKFYSLGVLSTTDTPKDSWQLLYNLSSPDSTKKLAAYSKMTPAYRSLVSEGNSDLYMSVSFKSAPIAHAWLNPERKKVDKIFADMIEDINSAGSDVGSAVTRAEDNLSLSY